MKTKVIVAIATIGLLSAACDRADEADVSKTRDVSKPTAPAPAYRDSTQATPPKRPSNNNMDERRIASQNSDDAMDIEGKELVGANGTELGDVDRIVIDRRTGEKMAVIGLKGIVGDGAKEVLVPMSQIKLSADGDKVVTNLSKAALEARPDVDPGDFTELPKVDY